MDLNNLAEEDLVDEDALLDGGDEADAVPTMRYLHTYMHPPRIHSVSFTHLNHHDSNHLRHSRPP